MTLNDLLRQGRSITEQLNSGDIPLIDAEGKEANIQLALHYSEDKDEPGHYDWVHGVEFVKED